MKSNFDLIFRTQKLKGMCDLKNKVYFVHLFKRGNLNEDLSSHGKNLI